MLNHYTKNDWKMGVDLRLCNEGIKITQTIFLHFKYINKSYGVNTVELSKIEYYSALRRKLNIKQCDIADHLKVTVGAISNFERGKLKLSNLSEQRYYKYIDNVADVLQK